MSRGQTEATRVQMPFGKHRGEALDAIPSTYLQWLASLDDLREPLKGAVISELLSRRQAVQLPLLPCPDPALAEQLVATGRRVLARKLHPDVGGTHHDFVRLGEVSEWLETVIGSAS
jgi:uncharacterized protein (DUF3820 family)